MRFFDVENSLDYYSFGMLMPERFGGGDYRYGYQSSEKDNKVKSEGNSYTTHFRQLDPRLGRWLTIDPKATAWESPYVSMGNMPIWANDVLGDKFKKQKHKDKLVKKIGERKNEIEGNIKVLEENISKINSKLSTADIPSENRDKLQKEKSKYQNELSEQNLMLGEMNEALREIKEMDENEVLFVTRKNPLRRGNGRTYAKRHDKVIISFGNYDSQIHEFKHGFQFIKGELSYNKNGENYLEDLFDERAAFRRDYSFNPNGYIYSNIKSYLQITNKRIAQNSEYSSLPNYNYSLKTIHRNELPEGEVVVSKKNRIR